MNLLDFSLGELLLGQIQDFIYYLTQRYIGTIVGHVYLACIQRSNVSTRFPHDPIISQSLSHLSLKMLFLFFLYYLLQGPSIDAGPIPTIENRPLAGNHCNNLSHCRTTWNIVWSCLVTIFSCTWVAVHPNVPCPKKRKANLRIERYVWNPLLSFAEHRLPLFICALLVPEYVLAWAIRQFLRAREIAHDKKGEFNLGLYFYQVISKLLLGRQWSMTHGFFMIMGGFHLFERCSEETSNDDRSISREDDKPLNPLQASDLVRCDGYESFIMPTEAEIKDKGKSDWLAKSLVLLQTSWFIMQCIARAIKHLPVTHLEIVTLAYAAMNFVIYIFWWNKPLNVNRPIRVFQKSEPSATQNQVFSRSTQHSRAWELTWEEVSEGLKTIVVYIAGLQDENVDLSRDDRVPRFWANSTGGERVAADIIVLGVGVCFGAIHCIAWGFSFPTHAELLMWRVSCVAITAVPVYITLGFFLGIWLEKMGFGITVLLFSPLSGGLLYILARAVTLVLAFTSLRDLPPGVYETVHWTTFIPHV